MASQHTFGVTGSDPFGISDASLAMVGLSQITSADPVIADDSRGEFAPESQKVINRREAIQADYKAQVISTITGKTVSVAGATPEAIESLAINCSAGQHSTMNVSGHRHIGGTNASHNNSQRKVELPAFPGFGASLFGLSVGVPEASIQSSSYTVTLGHTDDTDKDGNFLCGTTHGETHTATFEAIDETSWTIPEGWVDTENVQAGKHIEANNAHKRRRLTLVKYVGYNYGSTE